MTTTTPPTVVLTTFADAKEAYRSRDLRQSLYDEGEVVMADTVIMLHGDEHRARRRVENRLFRRETSERYEREMFPSVIEETFAPHVAAGRVDLVPLGHQLMLNLAALTAGVDRPQGTPEETARLYGYMMRFIEGATLAHSTRDKAVQRTEIAAALDDWDVEFLAPSIEARRRSPGAPADVLACLLAHQEELGLDHAALRREIAFYLLAAAHTSATAFVRSIDHLLGWIDLHPADAARAADDPTFVQRCVHETVRLNPSSPTGMRRALAPVRLRSGTEVPEGATVVIDLLAVNRDPEVFGPDAGVFDPTRCVPQGVAPFGLSFAAGMHVCIGQDLAAGVVPGAGDLPEGHLFGLVTGAVQALLRHGVRRDPDDAPVRDANTARPYWGRYPVLLEGSP